MHSKTSLLSVSVLLVACAGQSSTPSAAVPENLRPAATETQVAVVAAKGVQIYECRAKKDQPAALEWAFVAPQAELLDRQGRSVGKHYAGPHWESSDGSKIVGTVKARADAPQTGAIPWLLLTTKSVGGNGAFSKTTSIQRINTVGGAAPSEPCDATSVGKTARVSYTADYVLFAEK